MNELGEEVASKLRVRLADLMAVDTIDTFLSIHSLEPDDADRVNVVLSEEIDLIFAANHNINPTDESGRIIWSKVTRIKIVSIGKGH